MFKSISEEEFLNRKNKPINYIGIYEIDCIIDDNMLDCEGIIVSFEDKRYLIKSFINSKGNFDFLYFAFTNDTYECRKIQSFQEEQIYFIQKEIEEDFPCILRFQIGSRPILVTADDCLTIGISHWDINDNWLEFENNNLLND